MNISGINTTDGFNVKSQVALDKRLVIDKAENILSSIPVSQRYQGMTVFAQDTKTEYWFKNGITDADLIPKIADLSKTLNDSETTAPTVKLLNQLNEIIHKGGNDIIKKTFKDNKSSYTSSNTSFAVDADGIATLNKINSSNTAYIGIDPRPLNLGISSGTMVTVSAVVKSDRATGSQVKFIIDNMYGNRESEVMDITDQWQKVYFYYNFGTSDKGLRLYHRGDTDGIIYIKEGIKLYVGEISKSLEDLATVELATNEDIDAMF